MKYLILLLCIFSKFSFGLENSDEEIIDKILNKADLSVPFYNTDFLDARHFDLFKTSDRHGWFIHQSNYGGDGSNTGNILMIFDVFFEKDSNITSEIIVNKIYQYPISNVSFEFTNTKNLIIHGRFITTLCDSCDGWEVADEEDIFIIPIKIEVPSFVITTKLNQTEKQQMYDHLIRQVVSNNKVQTSYGNKSYPKFSNWIQKEVTSILQITK